MSAGQASPPSLSESIGLALSNIETQSKNLKMSAVKRSIDDYSKINFCCVAISIKITEINVVIPA